MHQKKQNLTKKSHHPYGFRNPFQWRNSSLFLNSIVERQKTKVETLGLRNLKIIPKTSILFH